MPFLLEPLFQKDHHEHGRHHKVEALGVKGNQGSEQSADGRARYPVEVVEQRDKKHEPALVYALRDFGGVVDGKGLIAHAEDQIKPLPAHPLELVQHRDAVKQVARLDHQCHDECLERGKGAEQHGHRHEF